MSDSKIIEIAFSTRATRSTCQTSEAAEQKYGTDIARMLIGRLADVRAAKSAVDLLALLPAAVDNLSGTMTIYLGQNPGPHIVVRVNHPSVPRLGDGTVDWSRVTRVKLMKIEVLQ